MSDCTETLAKELVEDIMPHEIETLETSPNEGTNPQYPTIIIIKHNINLIDFCLFTQTIFIFFFFS